MRDDVIQILAQLSDEYSSRTELYLKIRDQYQLLSACIPSGDTDSISYGMELIDSLMAEADICTFNITELESSLNSICGVRDFYTMYEKSATVISGIKKKRSESSAAAEKMADAGREFFTAAESLAEDYKKTAYELERTAAIMKFLPEQE